MLAMQCRSCCDVFSAAMVDGISETIDAFILLAWRVALGLIDRYSSFDWIKYPPCPIGPTHHEIVVWMVQFLLIMVLHSNLEKIALLSGFPKIYIRMLLDWTIFVLQRVA